MTAENATFGVGRLHRQLDGDDMREFYLHAEFGGQRMTLTVLLPEKVGDGGVAGELKRRAEQVAEMFAGTPCRIAYDTLVPATPAGAVVAQHTMSQLGLRP